MRAGSREAAHAKHETIETTAVRPWFFIGVGQNSPLVPTPDLISMGFRHVAHCR